MTDPKVPSRVIETIEKPVEDLELVIQRADAAYASGSPIFEDIEYDALVERLRYLKPHSEVLSRVSDSLLSTHEKVTHDSVMISIKDGFSNEDIASFCNKTEPPWSCEFKIDGLALSVKYNCGELVQAVTRGDGYVGDDVTEVAKTMRSLPVVIPYKGRLEVRGEAYITKKDFKGMEGFANPRNAAAGSLRLKSPREAASRPLSFLAYSCETPVGEHLDSHSSRMRYLHTIGFTTVRRIKSYSYEETVKLFDELSYKRDKMPIEIDGMVIKVDSIKKRESLGHVGKYPRWSLAAKFDAPKGITKLLDIELSVGRTGNVTPVGIFEPVKIAGSEVSRASLHNNSEILRKGIRIGCTVSLIKAGDIIPEVEKVLIPGDNEPYTMPLYCPKCRTPLDRSQLNWKCASPTCSVQKTFEFFVSRQCMNISGLGPKLLEKLVYKFDMVDTSDLLSISTICKGSAEFRKLVSIEGLTDYSANKLIESVKAALSIKPETFYRCLCIPSIGESTVKILADIYPNPAVFLDEIGRKDRKGRNRLKVLDPSKEDQIDKWLSKKGWDRAIRLFQQCKIVKPAIKTEGTKYTFVFTGKLSSPRSRYVSEAEELGHKTSKTISKSVDYLVVGEKAGSKKNKAEALGISILSEEEFSNIINK